MESGCSDDECDGVCVRDVAECDEVKLFKESGVSWIIVKASGNIHSGSTGIIEHSVNRSNWGGFEGRSECDRSLISLFVDNISPNTTRREIWETFGYYGKVCVVYISRKRRKGNRNFFGFVRFLSKREAEEVKFRVNGMCLGGQVLFLNNPRFDKKDRIPKSNIIPPVAVPYVADPSVAKVLKEADVEVGRGVSSVAVVPVRLGAKPMSAFDSADFGHRSFSQIVSGLGTGIVSFKNTPRDAGRQDASSPPNKSYGCKRIFGKDSNSEWLNRCAIAYVKLPNTERIIVDVLMREFKELRNVSILGNQQLLIEFIASEIRDEFIMLGIWSELFFHIKPWEDDVACSEKAVWLECSGIPLQSWSLSTFKEIANLWGRLICVFEDTIKLKNLSKAFIFISTKEVVSDKEVDFVVDNYSFAVKIREVGVPGFKNCHVNHNPVEYTKVLYESMDPTGMAHKSSQLGQAKYGNVIWERKVSVLPQAEANASCSAGLTHQSGRISAGVELSVSNLCSSVEGTTNSDEIMSVSLENDAQVSKGLYATVSSEGCHPLVFGEELGNLEEQVLGNQNIGGNVGSGDSCLVNAKTMVPDAQAEAISNQVANLEHYQSASFCPETELLYSYIPVADGQVGNRVAIQDGSGLGHEVEGLRHVDISTSFGAHTSKGKYKAGEDGLATDNEVYVAARFDKASTESISKNRSGNFNISMAKLEAIRLSIVEGISETIEMGLEMGIKVPMDIQVYIKAAMVKRQMYAMKMIFANG